MQALLLAIMNAQVTLNTSQRLIERNFLELKKRIEDNPDAYSIVEDEYTQMQKNLLKMHDDINDLIEGKDVQRSIIDGNMTFNGLLRAAKEVNANLAQAIITNDKDDTPVAAFIVVRGEQTAELLQMIADWENGEDT